MPENYFHYILKIHDWVRENDLDVEDVDEAIVMGVVAAAPALALPPARPPTHAREGDSRSDAAVVQNS
jgi:hypothetical protein